MYGSNSYVVNGRRIRVGPMLAFDSVMYALRFGSPSTDYTQAIISDYIDIKIAKGRTKHEIDVKVMELERALPAYADEFRLVRERKHLPVSRYLGPGPSDSLRRTQSTTASSPEFYNRAAIQRANTSNPQAARANPRRTSASAAIPARRVLQTTRPVEEEGEEAPPPYARMDPEPDSTRMLQESMAAGTLHPSLSRSDASQRPEQATEEVQETERTGTDHAAPLERAPSDPELRRIWEESQFEEAARLSRIAERERLELEEVMNVSLVEAEQRGERGGGAGGGEDIGGEGELGGFEDYTVSAGDSGQVREPTSSSIPRLPDQLGRSDHPEEYRTSAYSDLEDLMTPSYDQHQQDALHPDHAPSPQSREAVHKSDVLAATKTGAVMQSRNPFLSPAEQRDTDDLLSFDKPTTPEGDGTGAATQPDHLPKPSTPVYGVSPQTPQAGSSSHLPRIAQDSPHGSNSFIQPVLHPTTQHATQSPRQSKPLPSPPGHRPLPQTSPRTPGAGSSEQSFAPPPGPPPSHLRIPTSPNTPDTSSARQMFSPIGKQQPPLPPRPAGLQASLYSNTTDLSSPAVSAQQGFAQIQPQLQDRGEGSARSSADVPRSSFDTDYALAPTLPVRRETPMEGSQLGGDEQLGQSESTTDDPLDMLKRFDTVFLINDSASMAGDKWEQVMNVIIGVAELAAKYDEDGVDVYFLNSKRAGKELKTRMDVEDLFAGLVPRGSAPTGARLEVILREYMTRLERSAHLPSSPSPHTDELVKPMNLMVVTDGVPSDDPAGVIIAAARRLDQGGYPAHQVGIQFFQIGHDSEAREALQALEDGLEGHGTRNLVTAVPYLGEEVTPEFVVKTLLGGIGVTSVDAQLARLAV